MKRGEKIKTASVERLLRTTEETYKRDFKSPRDFEWLSEKLELMGSRLSMSTLKRLWGYIDENVNPHMSTLNTLARLLGYNSFSHFEQSSVADDLPSATVLSASIHPAQELDINDRMILSWSPGRVCEIRHLGKGQFVVEKSENTRLVPGNTFNCELMIEGEPLYIDNLVQSGRSPVGYVCGKRNGIHFQLMNVD